MSLSTSAPSPRSALVAIALLAASCAEPALETSYQDPAASVFWHSDSEREFAPDAGFAPVLLSPEGGPSLRDLYWWVHDRSTTPAVARLYQRDTSVIGAPAIVLVERPGATIEGFVRDFPGNPFTARLHWVERGADGATRLVTLISPCLRGRAAADRCFGADLGKAETRTAAGAVVGGALVIEHDGIEAFAVSPDGALRVVKGTDLVSGDHAFWLYDARGRSLGVDGVVNAGPAAAFTKASFPDRDDPNDRWASVSGAGVDVPSVAVDDRRNIYFCYGRELHRFGALDRVNQQAKRLYESTLGLDPDHQGELHEVDVTSPCRYVFVAGASRLLWASTSAAQAGSWIFSANLGTAQTLPADTTDETATILEPRLDEGPGVTAGVTRILANDEIHFGDPAPITSMSLTYSSQQPPTLVYHKGDALYRSVDELLPADRDADARFADPVLVWRVDRPIGSGAALQRANKLTGAPALYLSERAHTEEVSVCGGATGCPTVTEEVAGDLLQLTPGARPDRR